MARLVLFDIDGTLVNTGGAGRNAFGHTFSTAFKTHNGASKVSFAGRTDVSLVREIFGLHRIPATPENFQKFFDHYAFCLDHVMRQTDGNACRGVRDFIRDLQALPDPPMLGLLTGNIRLGAEIKLRHYDLWTHFETGGFADDHEDRNQIAVAALERGRRIIGNDLRPDEVVVVGDTPFDVRCAEFIGAKILAVATGGAKHHELKPLAPNWLVRDLTEISAREICPR
ncbi:MAG TPA: HAD hydrolase-like protein [Verrucomicrobiae bacterium]|jgi:phosphoglycolate phosphatase-like HAD superfamily hydrolase